MDHLDQLNGTAAALLDRVDQALTQAGAAPAHPVWQALRRVGSLPGVAVAAVALLDPDALDREVLRLRAAARAADEVAIALPRPEDWAGEAADAYDATRRRLAADISGGPGSLTEHLDIAAAYTEAAGRWMRETRRRLAATLAKVLCSAEAVLLLTADAIGDDVTGLPGQPAADIAALILDTIAAAYEEADELVAAAPLPRAR